MAFYTSLFILLVCTYTVQGAAIPHPDSYDITDNEIPDHDNEEIGGLLPPLESAVDYYNNETPKAEEEVRNSTYVIDMVNKVLRLVNERNASDDESAFERDFMKKVGMEFAQLFSGLDLPDEAKSDKNLKPTLRIGDDGISFELAGTDSKDDGFNVREDMTTEWDVMTTTDMEVMTTDPPQADESQPRMDDDSGSTFLQAVWDTLRSSFTFATKWILGSDSADATAAPTTAAPATSSALFALEEPLSRHRLPSQEFEKGGRDIDSLLYGRGIA